MRPPRPDRRPRALQMDNRRQTTSSWSAMRTPHSFQIRTHIRATHSRCRRRTCGSTPSRGRPWVSRRYPGGCRCRPSRRAGSLAAIAAPFPIGWGSQRSRCGQRGRHTEALPPSRRSQSHGARLGRHSMRRRAHASVYVLNHGDSRTLCCVDVRSFFQGGCKACETRLITITCHASATNCNDACGVYEAGTCVGASRHGGSACPQLPLGTPRVVVLCGQLCRPMHRAPARRQHVTCSLQQTSPNRAASMLRNPADRHTAPAVRPRLL